ncbi:MAG: class II aldolase/adducin family protein [Haloferacaceae archaeon]
MSDTLQRQLAVANRILATEGILKVFGHVSVRHPDGDKILVSRSRSPALVTEDDVLTMSLDGEVLDDTDARPYGETVIHRAIYRAREDVNAVVHHHAESILPFTVTDVPFKPAFHMAALFAEGVPKFGDYDDAYGRLVVGEAEGDRMAANLGDKRAQLLEGHGANVTGATLREAVIATVYFVMNGTYQQHAEWLGAPDYYEGPQASIDAIVEDVILADVALDRMWEYLLSRVDGDVGATDPAAWSGVDAP